MSMLEVRARMIVACWWLYAINQEFKSAEADRDLVRGSYLLQAGDAVATVTYALVLEHRRLCNRVWVLEINL
jgi:acyl-CoA thioesterase